MTKFFRTTCFRQNGGFTRELMYATCGLC
jgi:energy-converting hydrogenase Eha subunit F